MITLLHGDCRDVLRSLPERSVQCCVTSPPYWGLRSYEGVEPSVWGGKEDYCERHDRFDPYHQWSDDGFCKFKCGAWRGHLGLEPTLELFVEHVVEVFREVKRVLRDGGTLFLNIGDNVGNNQLVGVPGKISDAMKADSWYLIGDVIWFKTDANLDSACTRPRRRHEHVFVFGTTVRPYWDNHGVDGQLWRGDVWPIATANSKEGHFAGYPENLVDRCLRLGTSQKGCCSECGAPWRRVVEKNQQATRPARNNKNDATGLANRDTGRHVTDVRTVGWQPGCGCCTNTVVIPLEGLPDATTCGHQDGQPCIPPDSVPCTVLDPFVGSGTTLVVAKQLGLHGIGIDASKPYLEMARRRIENPNPEPEVLDVEGQMTFVGE